MSIKSISLAFGFSLFAVCVAAQDIHFSQYYNAPVNLSPALTGVHHGDVRFVGNYRSQWQSVDVDYTTFSASAEKKFYLDELKSGYFGAALLIDYDQAGTSNLSRTNIGMAGSYSLQLSPVFFMTGGVRLGISQRAFKPTNLTFDNQFNGNVFDPNIPRESFDRSNTMNIDLGAGLNLRLQPERANPLTKRTKLDFGISVHHLTIPNEAFNLGEVIKLPIRFNLYTMGTLMVSDVFDVLVRASAQLQGVYQENVIGASGKIFINRKPARETAFVLGAAARFNSFGDAIIPHAEFHIQRWMLGLSYDFNISELRAASSMQGGIEVAVQYLIRYVDTSDSPTKVCPII